ncbi:MAG: MMPL family transporter, partial [Planctomycetaceae bacterium]|nr:MMPL family transporter [Planctomycetaceae bacterium]
EGTLIGRDGRTTGVLLELLPTAKSPVSRRQTLAMIREVAANFTADVAVAGEPVQVFDMFELVEQDGQLLFLVSLAILSIVLLIMFRGLRWVLAPVGLVLGSVVLTRAVLYLCGARLSMVSSMLSSLVTVIGIATCMHVIVHYRDRRLSLNAGASPTPDDTVSQTASAFASVSASRGIVSDESTEPTDGNDCESAATSASPNSGAHFRECAAATLKEMAAPVFWTCVTTMVGFGSLFVSQITPVRSFAMMMCLGTAAVLFGCLLLLPATLASGSRLRPPGTAPLEHRLDRILDGTCTMVEHHPLVTAVLCSVVFFSALPGVFRLQVETDFSRNFKESSTIVKSLKFVESRLGGAGSWEVSFDTPPALTDEFLEQIQRLTELIRQSTASDNAIRVLSLTDVADLPPRIQGPARAIARIAARQPELVRNFYNAERCRMRIVLRSPEQQPSESKLAQIDAVRRCVREFFQTTDDSEQAGTSGMFILLAKLILSLLQDQLVSFIVACGGILICMTIAFRSLRIGIISLFPNIFPVAVLMGWLGWMDSPVNIGTAMITSVSMGITVDSTIHYIAAFERARRRMKIADALKVAHGGAGRAMVFAYLALICGFTVLTGSRFVPLIYFGALLSLSMIGGIFGDLVLLPLLLRWTTRDDAAANLQSDPSSSPR